MTEIDDQAVVETTQTYAAVDSAAPTVHYELETAARPFLERTSQLLLKYVYLSVQLTRYFVRLLVTQNTQCRLGAI